MVRSTLAGDGIALGRIELIRSMLQDRSLVAVKMLRPGAMNDCGYWLLRAEEQPRPGVAVVIAWLKAEPVPKR